ASPDLVPQLTCAEAAFTAGGLGIAQSAFSPQVIARPATPPTNLPLPTPPVTTPPAATPSDGSPPLALLVNRSCRHRRCTIVVAVTDADPSAGIAGVTASLTPPAVCHASRKAAAARKRCQRPPPRTRTA